MSARLPITLALLAAHFGCGDNEVAAPERPISYRARAENRVVVAEVNGEPVYADCVELQTRGRRIDRRAALDECIDFELLAQEARARGYLDHMEVAEARKTEAVRAFIDAEFPLKTKADIPSSDVEKLWKRAQVRFNHPENRTTFYCRAPVPKKAPRDGKADLEAEKLAGELYTALKDRRDLNQETLMDTCVRAAGDGQVEVSRNPFSFPPRGRAVPEFADATFAIPEVGMVSPPVRTDWGWDVILLTHILPARSTTFAEAEGEIRDMLFNEEAFAGYRRGQFLKWVSELKGRDRIWIDESRLENLHAQTTARLSTGLP